MDHGEGMRILVNPNSGPATSGDPSEALHAALPEADVVPLDGERTCRELLTTEPLPRAIGVAAGDGTVSAVAAVAIDLGAPLAVFPGGTLNHFAADLGLGSVDDTVEAVAAGRARAVDVAEIDGHLFVNNASLGAYPELVAKRERFEHRIGKWPALVVALVVVLRRGRPLHIDLDGRPRLVWLAFFGNGHYDREGLIAPAGRSRLDDGLIDVRLVHADRRWSRLRLVGCALLRRLDRCSVYEAFTSARITVRNHGGPLPLAADGEVFDGSAAFEVRKRPCALHVFAAPPGD